MTQAQQEIPLKIWKELAISKQILMRTATDVLKLDPECSQEELKEALEGALKRVTRADSDLQNAKEEAKAAISALEKKLAAVEQSLAIAQKAAADAAAAHEAATQQIANQRAAAAAELQKVTDRLTEREKSLKAINTALADTPENVLKKMGALKKQKQQEADSRREVEAALNAMRAEKRQQDQKLAEATQKGSTLVGKYRDLHALALQLHQQLQPLVAEGASLPAVPELDTSLLDAIEKPAEGGAKRPPAARSK